MHVRFVVNILGTKNCTQSALKPHNKSPETRINAGFPSSIFLFKLQFDGKQYKAKSTILSHFQAILDSLK